MKKTAPALFSILLCLLLLAGCGGQTPPEPPADPQSAASQPDPAAAIQLPVLIEPVVSPQPEEPPACPADAPSTELLVRYRGQLMGRSPYRSDNLRYDIRMYGTSLEGRDRIYLIDFTFTNRDDGHTQHFTYDVLAEEGADLYYDPNTFEQGLLVIDINQDGNDDIVLDLGASGKMTIAECYVYDSQSGEMVPVEGFELMSAFISYEVTGGPVVIAWDSIGNDRTPDGYDEGLSKYRVEGDRLILLSTVRYDYDQNGARYTVTDYTSGEPVVIAEHVPYDVFIQLGWYGIQLTHS